jgi:hypothetical protein
MDREIEIIADNGGGVTIQDHMTPYAHYYSDPRQVVTDLRAIVAGNLPDTWDGNEYDGTMIEYDFDMESNGGYQWFAGTAQEILDGLSNTSIDDVSWGNVREMILAL